MQESDASESRKQSTQRAACRQNNTDTEKEKQERTVDDLTAELEACKEELFEKDQKLKLLQEQLISLNQYSGLEQKEAAFEHMASELEKAQEIATIGSWVLDVDSGNVTWTPELHKIFGQDPSSPVPTLEEQQTWYTEKSWNDMMEAVTRTSQDGSPYNLELEMIRRDGTIGYLRSIGEAERDETGKIVRMRGVAQEITEIKEAETQLRQALEQEKTAQIYKDQFLANMSHEIRTPINGMVGFASLLGEEDLDEETRKEYISTIEKCSRQLLDLIDDIIDIAKIEAGEITVEKSPFNLANLIQETVDTLEKTRGIKGKKDITLETVIPEGTEDINIESDPLRIYQILNNLLNNALKFSDKGTIEIGYEIEENAVLFYVKDEGIGIEPSRAKRIFDRFEHLEDRKKKYEGTGLGLSISKGLANLLGGSLTFESEYGVGSTFRLKIPARIFTLPKKTPRRHSRLSSLGNDLNCTVLVAEDEETNQELVKRILKPTKAKALYAADGEEAVHIYKENPEIDVVLMDIRMPITNGYQAAKKILEMDPDAKIIALTAFAMMDERQEFLKAGFVDYLAKPYKAGDLLKLLNKWTNADSTAVH